jgi:hypothetical protein
MRVDDMIKIAAAVSGALLLVGAVVLLPGMTPMVGAGTTMPTFNVPAKTDRADKTDRLDIRNFGPGCSERGWPYYDASCIRNAGNQDVKKVRIVTTDRLPATIRFATDR